MMDFLEHHELVYVVLACSVILFVVVGGYVFMFLLIMKNDPREKQYRKEHNWDNTLVPFKYKDEMQESTVEESAVKKSTK